MRDGIAGAGLRGIPLLQRGAADDVAELLAAARTRAVAAGEVLFRRGAPSDALYMPLTAVVEVRTATPQGATLVLNRVGPGEALGEIGFLDGGPRSADAVATEAGLVSVLDRQAAMAVMLDRPALLVALLGTLCERLRATSGQVEAIAGAAELAAARHGTELAAAADANPLTGLPGNLAVQAAKARLAAASGGRRALCWIDLDHFKPFNDRFGLAIGDDAIRLCAATLAAAFAAGPGVFLGHVGGDDFFLGLEEADPRAPLEAWRAGFAAAARRWYAAEEVAAGTMEGKDRDGRPRRFPLLGASVAVIALPAGVAVAAEAIEAALAALKPRAKADGVAVESFGGG